MFPRVLCTSSFWQWRERGAPGAPDGCKTFDEEDNDVDLIDFADFLEHIAGPEVCVP